MVDGLGVDSLLARLSPELGLLLEAGFKSADSAVFSAEYEILPSVASPSLLVLETATTLPVSDTLNPGCSAQLNK